MKSKTAAWGLFIIVFMTLIFTYTMRPVWWTYADIFFFFMMAFCHLISVIIAKMNVYASKKLDLAALFFAIAGVIALIVEYILLNVNS